MSGRAAPMPAIFAGVVVVGAVAFVVGRMSVSEPPPREVVRYVEAPRDARRDAAAPPPVAGHGDHGHGDHPPQRGGPPSDATEIPTQRQSRDPVDFSKAFQAAHAAHDAPADEALAEQLAAAANELAERLLSDPAALSAALQRFPTLRDPAELETLATVLGRVRDPEVEDLALRLAKDPDLPARRAAAFDVLDAFDTPKARRVALEALGSERDAAVRRAALRAVPEPQGASQRQAGEVAATLLQLLEADPDPELRRRAAVMLGTWYRDPADLRPLLTHLGGDADINVRAGCAFALELTRRRDPEVLEALVRAMSDAREDPLVRDNAWKALAALSPLPDVAHAAYEAYRAERDAAGEAGGR
ncbi:MAG: HEAT repeat domain-containing protein [Planctomycetota bacterium]